MDRYCSRRLRDCNNNNNIRGKSTTSYDHCNYFTGGDSFSTGSFLGGFSWPPRSYTCSFCKREFRSAQALGGHMNVHRRDRARLRESSSWDTPTSSTHEPNPNPNCPDDQVESVEEVLVPNLNHIPPLNEPNVPAERIFCPPTHNLVFPVTQPGPSPSISKCFYSSKPLLGRSDPERKNHVQPRRKSTDNVVRLDLKIGIYGDDLGDDLDLELRLGYA